MSIKSTVIEGGVTAGLASVGVPPEVGSKIGKQVAKNESSNNQGNNQSSGLDGGAMGIQAKGASDAVNNGLKIMEKTTKAMSYAIKPGENTKSAENNNQAVPSQDVDSDNDNRAVRRNKPKKP